MAQWASMWSSISSLTFGATKLTTLSINLMTNNKWMLSLAWSHWRFRVTELRTSHELVRWERSCLFVCRIIRNLDVCAREANNRWASLEQETDLTLEKLNLIPLAAAAAAAVYSKTRSLTDCRGSPLMSSSKAVDVWLKDSHKQITLQANLAPPTLFSGILLLLNLFSPHKTIPMHVYRMSTS